LSTDLPVGGGVGIDWELLEKKPEK
jgi:hypothetical protein